MIRKILQAGTDGLAPAERPVIRLVNTISLLCITGAVFGLVISLPLDGFQPVVVANSAVIICICMLPLYLNYRQRYRLSKWALVFICHVVIVSTHFSVNYEVGSWVLLLGLFPLYVALFDSRRETFIFSLLSFGMILMSIYLQSRPSFVPLATYFGSELLVIQYVYISLGIGFVLFFSFFMKHNLNRQRQLLNKALEEKDVLLREVHHRVKNNLQVITSMLNIQERRIEPEQVEMRRFIEAAQGRIQSMALVHQQLYAQNDLKNVRIEAYITDLIRHLKTIYHTHGSVSFDVTIDDSTLPADKVVPLGLIINEAVSNAYKHAFRDEKGGRVSITLSTRAGLHTLLISDDGAGLHIPEDRPRKGIGLQLIADMADQLNGNHSISGDSGVRHEVTFPAAKYEA